MFRFYNENSPMLNAYILWLVLIVLTLIVMGVSNASKPANSILAYTSPFWDFLFVLFWSAFLESYFFASADISLGKTPEGIIVFWASASLPIWVLDGWRKTKKEEDANGSRWGFPLVGILAVIFPLALLVEQLFISWWSLPKLPDFL